MELKKQRALALIAGPIEDAGQLCLALVINEFEGEDGWAYTTTKELARMARLGRTAGYKKLAQMERLGLIEHKNGPVPAVRVVHDAAPECREAASPTDREECREAAPECREAALQCRQTDSPNASAYLPKRSKDKEEEDKDPSPSSSPGVQLTVIAGKQAEPISTAPNQPAAQPPAIVDQGAQLPAKPKRQSTAGRATCIPDGWEVPADTLDHLEQTWGIPRAFSEALTWEFRNFWSESRGRKKSWSSTFIRHAKIQWKREQEHEQNAKQRERFTDASGKRLSEATVTMQDAHENVLAHADFFASLDPDKPI